MKSSFFNLIAGIVKDMPTLADEQSVKLFPAVLSRLGETDPVICPNLWEAVERTTSIEVPVFVI